jgi:hypothetical protein
MSPHGATCGASVRKLKHLKIVGSTACAALTGSNARARTVRGRRGRDDVRVARVTALARTIARVIVVLLDTVVVIIVLLDTVVVVVIENARTNDSMNERLDERTTR